MSEVASGAHPILTKDVFVGGNKRKMQFVLCSSKTHGLGSQPQIVKFWLQHPQRPFELLRNYAQIRGEYNGDRDPFYVFSDGSPVKPRHVHTCLKQIVREAGFDLKHYGTHSFRAGRSCDLHKLGLCGNYQKIRKMEI